MPWTSRRMELRLRAPTPTPTPIPHGRPPRSWAVCLAYPVGNRKETDGLDSVSEVGSCTQRRRLKKGPQPRERGSSNQVDTDRPHWAPAIEGLKPSWKRLARKTRFQPAEKTYVGNSASHGFFLLFSLVPQSPALRGLLRKPEARLAPVWTRAVTPKSCNVSRKGGVAKSGPAFPLGPRCRLESPGRGKGRRVGGRVDRRKQPWRDLSKFSRSRDLVDKDETTKGPSSYKTRNKEKSPRAEKY
jgi:hypothetical protein